MEKRLLSSIMMLLCLLLPATIAAQQINENAPDRVQSLSAEFEGPSLTGTVSFNLPTSSYGGNALTGDVSYKLNVAYAEQASGKGKPGEKITCQVKVPYAYNTLFAVTTSNTYGNGPTANLYKWVGYAEPKAVTNLKGTFNAADKSITISWDAVTEAQSEGYFNTDDISYIVMRMHDNGFGFDRDTVAKNLKATTFTDHPEYTEATSYSYVVTSVNGDVLGYTAQTPNINVGETLTPPFTEHFDTQKDFNRWNVIDANSDWDTWEYDYYGQQAQYHYGNVAADDWLLSPDLQLTTGHDYKLSFKARSANSGLLERLAVALGQGDEAAGYTNILLQPQLFPAADTIVSCTFAVPEEGKYRIGFHALSDADHNYLYLDDVSVVAGAEYSAPGKASEIHIINDRKGPSVSFKAPTITVDGKALSSITKVLLLRGDTLVVDSTLSVEPGESVTLKDANVPTGLTTYSVVAYNASGEGLHAMASAFIGFDVPTAPRNVKLTDNLDGTATLSWTLPEKGKNGGDIDYEKLRFNVYTIERQQMIAGEKIAEGISETTYTISDIDQIGKQQVLYYGVSSVVGNDESDPVASTPIISGKPDELPYMESFANGHIEHDLLWTEQKGIYPFNVTTQYSADGDKGAAYWYTDSIGEEGWINTGKIAMTAAHNPKMVFSYRANPGANMVLKVEVSTSDNVTDTLAVINMAEFKGQKFVDYSVDLSKYSGKKYIIVKFNAIGGEHYSPILVDNIRIVDAKDGDLAVDFKSLPDSMQVSHASVFRVKVINCGATVVSEPEVRLIANGETIDAKSVPSLNPLEASTVDFSFTPSANYGDDVEVQAVVESDGDSVAENNKTAYVIIPIGHNTYEVPVLSASAHGNSMTLSWNAPKQDHDQITDNIEDYKAFSISGFGPWSVIDGDSANTYALEEVDYPNATDPKAFMVFNPYTLLGNLHNNENLSPHSGRQYLVSFDAGSNAAASDDWLVSPQAFGGTSVSLFVKGISDDYGSETMEMCYSTKGTAKGDFQKIGDTYTVKADKWTNINVELPADAKYFAVHSTSKHCFGLMVDDITYSVPMEVTGYNVYKDGKLLASVPAETLSYNVTAGDEADYQVSAVYNRGESNLSNKVDITTGINVINATSATVEAIYSPDGKRTDKWQRGINIVKMSDGTVKKVIYNR